MTIELQEDQINELKEIVLNYLQGQDLDIIQVRLQTMCSKKKSACKTLYDSIRLNAPSQIEVNNTVDPLIPAILGTLNIEEPHQTQLIAQYNNLHGLLSALSTEGEEHLIELLKRIDNTKPNLNRTLIFMMGALLSASIGGLAYVKKEAVETIGAWFSETFPLIINWLKTTFSLLRNFHLLAAIVNAFLLIWNWYTTLNSYTATSTTKFNMLLFKTLSTSLTISAYMLCFFAAGIATLPAIILFVASAATGFFQGTFNWWKNSTALTELNQNRPNSDTTYINYRKYEITKNFQIREIASAWVKIIAALLTTLSVTIWFMYPPSFIVSACFMSFNFLVALSEQSFLANINERANNELQTNIDKIPRFRGSLRPSNQTDQAKFHIAQDQFKKHQQEQQTMLEQDRNRLYSEREQLKVSSRQTYERIRTLQSQLKADKAQLQEREALLETREAECLERTHALTDCDRLIVVLNQSAHTFIQASRKLQRPEDSPIQTPPPNGRRTELSERNLAPVFFRPRERANEPQPVQGALSMEDAAQPEIRNARRDEEAANEPLNENVGGLEGQPVVEAFNF